MGDESAFLAAIRATPIDDTARLVYADWLDEQGRAGGTYLRAECALAAVREDDSRRPELLATLRQVGAGIDPTWLAAVSRVPVEGCGIEFRFRCPKRWDTLRETADASVRFCEECRQQVFFCGSIELARSHTALGECVAVDPRLVRKPNDLAWDLFGDEGIVMGMFLPDEQDDSPKQDEAPPPAKRRRK